VWRRLLRIAGPSLSLLLLGAALFVLYRELQHYRVQDVARSIGALPRWRLGLALLFTLASYTALTGYDTLAFRYIRYPLPYRRIAFASFVSYAFGHSVGPWLFGGGAVRYRLLSAWRLSSLDIARVVLFCVLTFWLGFFTLGGLALIVDPPPLSNAWLLRMAGVLCLGAAVAYLAWARSGKHARVRGVEVAAPKLSLAASQVLLSSLDWLLAASALYVLLPPAPGLSFPRFAGIFVLTTTVALWSNVPAGLGVLETALVLLLAPYLSADVVLASVLAYRVVYYLLPLVVGIALLGAHEALRRWGPVTRLHAMFSGVAAQILPRILAVTTFVSGVILLLSGATPAAQGRMSWLRDFVPLPVVEVSHFLASLVGMGLLLLARGIQRRVDAAYLLACVLLAVGIVTSLLKGLDYEEASILTLVLALLLPSRRYFYRKSSLLGRPLTAGWIVAILFVLQGVVFLTFWSHKHVEYSNDLWWQFTFGGHASRALRAALGAILLLTFYGAARLIRPAPPAVRRPRPVDLERAREAVGLSPDTSAHLALLGDKSLLFNDRGTAFVMYAVQGRSWVAMGDPVGPEEEQRELAWSFRELADLHGGWTVFYQVGARRLPMYLDLGLTLLKLGEEGRVPLATFSLEGAARKSLRPTIHRLEREQCELVVLDVDQVPPVLDELRAISDEWIAARNTREKRFSLGYFDEAYLRLMPVALVRRAGRIVAFANVWRGADKEELSIDLMRHRVDAPAGVMEYLFVHVMLWGKARGYRYFNLGMAPLSGFELRPLAPLWTRAGALLFRYGEHFYNFEGLRRYKEKFDPEWQPRYLASPGGLVLPRVLTNVATLISGSLVGVIAK
jgi:phosphatidylglycerol lysyltransferase